jgi:hypothetical protein
MSVTLGDDEARTLAELIDKYLPELDFELARIKLPHERKPLVEFEQRVTAVRKKLV